MIKVSSEPLNTFGADQTSFTPHSILATSTPRSSLRLSTIEYFPIHSTIMNLSFNSSMCYRTVSVDDIQSVVPIGRLPI